VNVVVLMSGGSDGFKDCPYPKNLVEINDEPLAQHVLKNLLPVGKVHCLVKKEEILKFHTDSVLRLIDEEINVIPVYGDTLGAACTALLGVDFIDNDEPLIIANGDQVLNINLGDVVSEFQSKKLDGGIIVFDAIHPRWSYVKVDDNGLVIQASEKNPISRLATAGVYYFKKGKDFVRAASNMIKKGQSVNGLFYVCPVYNELILEQKKIGVFKVDKSVYNPLNTVQSVKKFESQLR
jgi:dTDP-glucose pyrophosphorylase